MAASIKTRKEFTKMSKPDFIRLMKKEKLYKSSEQKTTMIDKYLKKHAKSIDNFIGKSNKNSFPDAVSLNDRVKYLCSYYIREKILKNQIRNNYDASIFPIICLFIGNIFCLFDVYHINNKKCIKSDGIILQRNYMKYRLKPEEHRRMSDYKNARKGGGRTKVGIKSSQRARILFGCSFGITNTGSGAKYKWTIKTLCDIYPYGNDGFGVTNMLSLCEENDVGDYSAEKYNVQNKFTKNNKNNYKSAIDKHCFLYYPGALDKNDEICILLNFNDSTLNFTLNGDTREKISINPNSVYFPVIYSQTDNTHYQITS